MKANVFTSALVALFLFAANIFVVKADSDALLYHNSEKLDNVVSTTYFKGNGNSENLIPFKKKVNTLNEQGVCISKVTYLWNANGKNWLPVDKMDYTYDGTRVASVSRSTWNQKSNDWNTSESMIYNQNGETLNIR